MRLRKSDSCGWPRMGMDSSSFVDGREGRPSEICCKVERGAKQVLESPTTPDQCVWLGALDTVRGTGGSRHRDPRLNLEEEVNLVGGGIAGASRASMGSDGEKIL